MKGDDDERWWMEYYTQKTIENRAIVRARSIAVAADRVNYFRKILFLRVLQDCILRHTIEEWLLQNMLLLEEILRSEGSPASAAFRAAFCAVAVDCTVKHLQRNACDPSYLAAVRRIWGKWVKPSLCRFFSEELESWSRDIDASVGDLQVRENLAAIEDTKELAINRVKIFLSESWKSLDLSLLVRAVENDAAGEQQQGGAQKDNHMHDGNCTTSAAEETYPQTCQSDVPPTTKNAHAHEGGTSNRTELPSPRRTRVSHLKKHGPPNATRKRKQMWSPLEAETLEKAVNEFGYEWIKILNTHKDVFKGRTNVNLKDKWRNMRLYGGK